MPWVSQGLPNDKRPLLRALERWHAQYDPAEQMLKRPYSSPGYHSHYTGPTVHPTRESLTYAVALLDTGEPALIDRAAGVIDRVIALHDQDPDSRSYGIWSWFLEEPLSAMGPPDWNWADFCGAQLLQALIDHAGALPAGLTARIHQSIEHAARSIVRRDVSPGYTNIALMGGYVTVAAGERLPDPELLGYGRRRWQRIAEHAARRGPFTEYNSPTYTRVAIVELARTLRHVQSVDVIEVAERLYAGAWQHLARRYHAPSGQWAGPHSRCYDTLQRLGFWSFLEEASDRRLGLLAPDESAVEPDWWRLGLRMPEEIREAITSPRLPRTEIECFTKAEPGEPPALVGTTHLTADYALGSINRADLWNQRRPLLLHWGSRDRPSYLRLRCLHDGYDFCSALAYVAQRGGEALLAMNFATDNGDTHPSLDKISDGCVQVRDLRIRFEIGGDLSGLTFGDPAAAPARISANGLAVELTCLFAGFAGLEFETSVQPEPQRLPDGAAAIDWVLYGGERRPIDLRTLDRAAAAFALRVLGPDGGASGEESDSPRASVADGRLRAVWPRPDGELGVEVPLAAAPIAKQMRMGHVWAGRE